MFYKDQHYIGVRRPFDYPNDINFKNKYIAEDIRSSNFYENSIAPSDFNGYKGEVVYSPTVDFGFAGMGDENITSKFRKYIIPSYVLAAVVGWYIYNNKIKSKK